MLQKRPSITSSPVGDGQGVPQGRCALPLLPCAAQGQPQPFATSEKSWIFLFSPLLGLLLHSIPPPFIKVSKSTTLAGPGMQRTTRGATSAAAANAPALRFPAPLSAAELLLTGSCNQAQSSGPRGFMPNIPKYSKPSSTQTHLKFTSSQQHHPKLSWSCPSKPGGQAKCQRCANTDVLD